MIRLGLGWNAKDLHLINNCRNKDEIVLSFYRLFLDNLS